MYFVQEDGQTFKASYALEPYLLIFVKDNGDEDSSKSMQEVESFLLKTYAGLLVGVRRVMKEDLDMLNHLSGQQKPFLELRFRNQNDLQSVRARLQPIVFRNQRQREAKEVYDGAAEMAAASSHHAYDHLSVQRQQRAKRTTIIDNILEMREYDLPYVQRICIDMGFRVGMWYEVRGVRGNVSCDFKKREDVLDRPLLKTLAYDIETTKLPLKFPDATFDKIMMISYMIDGQGYLIVNREIVSKDIQDFDYTPKPEFDGPFEIFNEPNEKQVIQRFFMHTKELAPHIMVTYNGDFFDMPFVDKRATVNGLSMEKEIGISVNQAGEYDGRFIVHLDAFYWVKRDSYLPQGSQGLKAVTKAKLKYNPQELDPEDMLPFATSKPQVLASYSVSDAVATYYLYQKYVHSFIYSLCNIIPLAPKDVLRKGSGTLCEVLLMVKAFEGKIVFPNKQKEAHTKFHNNHLLESETYIGGHVECLESGVFREDFEYDFKLTPSIFVKLLSQLDDTLRFAIVEEAGLKMEDIVNYDEVRDAIKSQLEALRDKPNFKSEPLIYHLDVGAMYPNIILTNRLQPMACVDEGICAACDFNRPGKSCQLKMEWKWRGKHFPASRNEYEVIKTQLETEQVQESQTSADGRTHNTRVPFTSLRQQDQAARVKKRLGTYSQHVYKKTTIETVETKQSIICQRENPFYVNTVRDFRDRRYYYKAQNKKAGIAVKEAKTAIELQKAKDLQLLFDSLQLAHKCILNSFYGYVMRKGARWRSIEMAGVVTHTGANIIKDARVLVEQIGRALELDTDGIWAILPKSFPENFKLQTKQSQAGNGRPLTVEYPCIILNKMVNDDYTNHQYQDLDSLEKRTYTVKKECTIFFEVDGPYKAMVLPAAQKEGENIKKRYAVFNMDGTLAELKGFEIKRRGELKLIKIFQGQVFKAFLDGATLQLCYDAVGAIANHWLDICYNKGADLEDDDVFELVSENKTMREAAASYGDRKSVSLTCAHRLAQFLGEDMIKDKGLNCKFIIAKKPIGASTSARAIPVAIWSAEDATRRHYLRKWLKDQSLSHFDVREIIDWSYYITRLGSAIQKIITIPAAFQRIANPVPRCKHPAWLLAKVREQNDPRKQTSINSYFSSISPEEQQRRQDEKYASSSSSSSSSSGDGNIDDLEDAFGSSSSSSSSSSKSAKVTKKHKKKKKRVVFDVADDGTMQHREEVVEADDDDDNDDGIADGNDDEEEDIQRLLHASEAPDPAVDFQGWLNHAKQHWNKQRKLRLRSQKLAEERRQHTKQQDLKVQDVGMRAFMQNQMNALRQSKWEIIQIAPNTPGVFRVWAYIMGSIRCMTVTVPRTFFVNTRSPNEVAASMGHLVKKSLPRGRPCLYLYEVTMNETEFNRTAKDLHAFLSNEQVEGVYESHTPLLFHAVMSLGTECKVNQETIDHEDQVDSYDLSQLIPNFSSSSSSSSSSYLSSLMASGELNRVYFYHSHCDERGVYGVFSETSDEALIVMVLPGGAADLKKLGYRTLMKKVWTTQANHLRQSDPQAYEEFQASRDYNFTVRACREPRQAYVYLKEFLTHNMTSGAWDRTRTVLMTQTPEELEALYVYLPVLKSDFPIITMPTNDADNVYPTLQWQRMAVLRMFQRLTLYKSDWNNQLTMCQYARVPIGNLDRDSAVCASDVMYARELRSAGHLLWISDSHRPDLGGVQEEENYFDADLSNPEICNPGCFRSVCVEIELSHMAVNTILKADAIQEIENGRGLSAMTEELDIMAEQEELRAREEAGTGGMVLTSRSASYAEGTYACRHAFIALKNLITRWMSMTIRNNNRDSDMLLGQVYRWLRSPTSKLYDPSLLRMLHQTMKKVLLQLVQRIRKLRGTVIFASFTSVVLCTHKPSVMASMAYLGYLMNSLQSKPVFQFAHMKTVKVWEALIFMDSRNYGGLESIVEDENAPQQQQGLLEQQQQPEEEQEETKQSMDVMSPPPQQGTSSSASPVRGRMKKITMRSRALIDSSDEEEEEEKGFDQQDDTPTKRAKTMDTSETPSKRHKQQQPQQQQELQTRLVAHWNIAEYLPADAGKNFVAMVTEFMEKPHLFRLAHRAEALKDSKQAERAERAYTSDLVQHYFHQRACQIVELIKKKYPSDVRAARENRQSDVFPTLPGSHLPLTDPALEFVKFVTHVFCLDGYLQDEVTKLKGNLMRLLGVKEFAKETTFQNPCLTFVLPDTICSFCNSCRDLDLCRDPDLIDKNWVCDQCHQSYDLNVIELMLVNTLSKRSVSYQVQDLTCTSCGKVKRENANIHCQCSGRYACMESTEGYEATTRAFENIALYYGFEWLQDAVDWDRRLRRAVTIA